jgi:hypothetical protein
MPSDCPQDPVYHPVGDDIKNAHEYFKKDKEPSEKWESKYDIEDVS